VDLEGSTGKKKGKKKEEIKEGALRREEKTICRPVAKA